MIATPSPTSRGMVAGPAARTARRAIAQFLDDEGYSLGAIGSIDEYIQANGSAEGYPFLAAEWHRRVIERMLPDQPDECWGRYDAWRWEVGAWTA